MGLVQFGGLQKPYWDQGSIAEEVRWGCDYYQKIVRDDGGMFDSVFIPLGRGPRDYYPSDPPAPALWNNIRHQAMAAEYFKDRDAAYAAKCRQTAERVWRYMTSDKRPKGKYAAGHAPARARGTEYHLLRLLRRLRPGTRASCERGLGAASHHRKRGLPGGRGAFGLPVGHTAGR